MLRCGCLHTVLDLDQEQVDCALVNEPEAVRIVEFHWKVAGTGHGRTRTSGKLGNRDVFLPAVLHQLDFASL